MVLEERLVAILDLSETPVGAGLLIDDDLVLTCAHVVNQALDRDDEKTRPTSKVHVRVHRSAVTVDGTIEPDDGWRPPPASKNGGDLCILRLPEETAKGLGPAHLREYTVMRGRPFHAAGYPKDWGTIDYADGSILGTDSDGLYMLASEARGQPASGVFSGEKRPAGVIHRGFSGGPVESDGEIIGLLTQARRPRDATSYMTPIASFGTRFKPQMLRFANRVSEVYSHVSKLNKEARTRSSKHETTFDLRLRFCENFTEVLDVHRTPAGEKDAGDYEKGRDLRPFEAARSLRVRNDIILLHAPGGAGKSSFLFELLLAASDENLVPFLLDFSRVDGKAGPEASDAESQLRSWFSEYKTFGQVGQLLELASSTQNLKPLLVIDGLNQISVKWADVLATISKLSSGALSGAVIVVSDRMVERGLVMEDFVHAVIPPLEPAVYREALKKPLIDDPSWRPILTSPIFLNLLLDVPRKKDVIPSRFHILNIHFRNECKLSPEDLRTLADFAFDAYKTNRQTAISKEQYEEFTAKNTKLAQRIEDKGLIQNIAKGVVEFRHQLLHDALAALKVASANEAEEESLLRGPAFDVLSLNAASPDAVELAVEALLHPDDLMTARADPLEPRELLAAVFDWNHRITLQCVASFDRRGDSPLPLWLRHAIYGHNLERLFDPYLHTAWHAERMKSLIPESPELTYLKAENHSEITGEVGRIIAEVSETTDAENKYRLQWLAVYRRESPFTTTAELEPLWSDPFVSWTAANVIRRFDNKDITDDLLRMYDISRATSDSAFKAASFRWRIVHALGRGAPSALGPLLAASLDHNEMADVRYGAVRSLIELAVTGADKKHRDDAFEKLEAGLPSLFKGPWSARVRKEFRRTCAFNESHVDGRTGWREDWLGDGLQRFTGILRYGQSLAKDLAGETELWSEWASTASSVPTDVGKWEERKVAWLKIIEKDQ